MGPGIIELKQVTSNGDVIANSETLDWKNENKNSEILLTIQFPSYLIQVFIFFFSI